MTVHRVPRATRSTARGRNVLVRNPDRSNRTLATGLCRLFEADRGAGKKPVKRLRLHRDNPPSIAHCKVQARTSPRLDCHPGSGSGMCQRFARCGPCVFPMKPNPRGHARRLGVSLSHARGFVQWAGALHQCRVPHMKAPRANLSATPRTARGDEAAPAEFSLRVCWCPPVGFRLAIRHATPACLRWRLCADAAPNCGGFRALHLLLLTHNPATLVHEETAHPAGWSTPPAHSRPDPADGQGTCGPALSRCVAQAPADDARMVAGRAGPRAQAGARRLLNLWRGRHA